MNKLVTYAKFNTKDGILYLAKISQKGFIKSVPVNILYGVQKAEWETDVLEKWVELNHPDAQKSNSLKDL